VVIAGEIYDDLCNWDKQHISWHTVVSWQPTIAISETFENSHG